MSNIVANGLSALWDAKDAAAFLKVSRSWVYQQAEAGLLPHLRIGGLIRFEPSTVREFVRRHGVTAETAAARLGFRGAQK